MGYFQCWRTLCPQLSEPSVWRARVSEQQCCMEIAPTSQPQQELLLSCLCNQVAFRMTVMYAESLEQWRCRGSAETRTHRANCAARSGVSTGPILRHGCGHARWCAPCNELALRSNCVVRTILNLSCLWLFPVVQDSTELLEWVIILSVTCTDKFFL